MVKFQKYFLFLFLAVIVVFSACDDIIDDDDSTVEDREKFLGNWETTETSTLYPQPITFQVSIEEDINSSQIRLYNIYQLGIDVYAYAVVTGTSFTIPEQTVNNMIIEGYAYMDGENKINIDYTVNDGADLDEVTGEMLRVVPTLLPSGNLAVK